MDDLTNPLLTGMLFSMAASAPQETPKKPPKLGHDHVRQLYRDAVYAEEVAAHELAQAQRRYAEAEKRADELSELVLETALAFDI